MKRLTLGLSLAIFSLWASATTLNPIQLLNPTGSTTGQAILSTGASSAPGWATISSANVSGLGTAAAQNTGTSGANIPLLNGANTWASGQTFSASITPSQTSGIIGTTTNNNANAGSVGELLTNTTTGTALTSPSAANATSISLTAGDWEVSGTIQYNPAAGTTIATINSSISTVSATVSGTLGATNSLRAQFNTAGTQQLSSPVVRISVASTTTVFLVAAATFAVSTMTADGAIRARRVR